MGTCQEGCLIHDDVLPPDHLALLTEDGGMSKESRALNELMRRPSGRHGKSTCVASR